MDIQITIGDFIILENALSAESTKLEERLDIYPAPELLDHDDRLQSLINRFAEISPRPKRGIQGYCLAAIKENNSFAGITALIQKIRSYLNQQSLEHEFDEAYPGAGYCSCHHCQQVAPMLHEVLSFLRDLNFAVDEDAAQTPESLVASMRQAVKDWQSMLKELAALSDAMRLDDNEWRLADDNTIFAELDPWYVVRETTERVAEWNGVDLE